MGRITAEQRRNALRNRTKRGINERGQTGMGRKSVLDFSKVGDRRIIKYEIKSGKESNYIDILPFEITQSWYKNLKSVSGSAIGLEVGFTDYKLEVPVHRNVGENNDVFLCLKKAFGKKCPLCEEMYAEWDKDEDDQDEKKIKALKPSWRCYYNVSDYDGNEESIQLWEDVSYFLFEEALQEAMETEDDGIVTFSDLEMGSSIEFKGRKKKLGKNEFTEAHSISFRKRDSYKDDILKETFPLDAMLIIPTYEQVAKCHLGMDEENGNEDQKQKNNDEQKITKTRTRKRFEKQEEEKQEEEKQEGTPPWKEGNPSDKDTCPEGREFGVDCDPSSTACENCEEDTFQACAAKHDELQNEPVGNKKKEDEENKKDVKENKTEARSRRRTSSSDNNAKSPGRRRKK